MKPIFANLASANSRLGRRFESLIQVLIVASIVSFCAETTSLLRDFKSLFDIFEYVVTAIFTFEYLIRLVATPRKIRFVLSFYGLIDLAAILPFYLSMGGVDLRVARIFRLLRLFRTFKLIRYTRAVERLKMAYSDVKDELVVFGVLAAFILFLASAGIFHCENKVQPEKFGSIFDAFWWSVCTLTTVGYGDVYPITPGGKIFTILILFLGLGIVAIPTALLATSIKGSPSKTSFEEAPRKAS